MGLLIYPYPVRAPPTDATARANSTTIDTRLCQEGAFVKKAAGYWCEDQAVPFLVHMVGTVQRDDVVVPSLRYSRRHAPLSSRRQLQQKVSVVEKATGYW